MNFHQQQQIAQAQQMAAQYGGGLTPQQQQQMAMAQQMAAQYGGAPVQGAPAGVQYQQAAYGQPVAANPYAAYGQPTYAAPGAPMAAPMAAPASDGTIVAVTFPDGCMIGWDRLRNELIINGKVSNTRMRQMPARPLMSAAGSINVEEPSDPVEKTGMMTKLGWKKNAFGGDSWQQRYFRLTDTSISYAKDASSPPINTIALNNGIVVNVVNAATPARKNRYAAKSITRYQSLFRTMSQPAFSLKLACQGIIRPSSTISHTRHPHFFSDTRTTTRRAWAP